MTIQSRLRYARRLLLLAGAALALTAAALASVGTGAPVARAASSLPCDIYASGGTPCVAAYSTTRALYAAYNGPLYQVQRSSDGSYLNIGLLAAGGDANAAPQASFCAGTTCTITKIYDQSANHSDLPISSGGFWKGPGPNGSDIGANAMALPVTIGGNPAYGIRSTPGTGYRVDNINVPTGSQPEGVYEVTSSNLYNNQCCFDFGSGEVSHTDTGNGHMNAIEWGNACWFGGCTGPGPWVEADLENGMYSTNTGPNSANNPGVNYPFVSAWEKNNGTSNFTLKYGNATSGGLTTTWSGSLPNGYSPMHEEADILLGTGGDNSNGASGEFFEGAITNGYPSDATENSVQAELATAGYGSRRRRGDRADHVGHSTAPSASTTAPAAPPTATRSRCGTASPAAPTSSGLLRPTGPCRSTASAWTSPAPTTTTAPSSSYGSATAEPTSNGRRPTVNWSTPPPASAWTTRTPTPPTAPSSSCGPATAAPTSNGTCPSRNLNDQ